MRPQTYLVATIAAAAFAIASTTGCGEKEESTQPVITPVRVALDFYVNPDHVGLYQALDSGAFDRAGLDVKPAVPTDPSAPIRQVASGAADIAISYEPEVMLAAEQGLPVVAVAALIPRPLTSLISLPEAGIEEPSDLRGKTIATAGIPYQTAFLDAIASDAGINSSDFDQVDVGLGLLPAVISGRADAMLGGFTNVEGVDLAERGLDPAVVAVDELGIPTYDELVLVTSREKLEQDPETIRLFISLLQQGTREAADDPAAATDALLEAGDGLDPKLTRAEVDATLPLLLERKGDQPLGYMDPQEWSDFASFLVDAGLLDSQPQVDELLDNSLLGPAAD